MDNALQQYLQQKNRLASPDQVMSPLTQQQQPDDSMSQLAQSQQQLQNALQAYKQGKVGAGVVQQAQGDFAGQCQKWAELQTYGHAGIFGSAAEAANHYESQGQLNPDVSSAPAGSLVYFGADASNGGAGHVGIADGRGNFTSATYNGIKTVPLGAWTQSTGQKILGYVKP